MRLVNSLKPYRESIKPILYNLGITGTEILIDIVDACPMRCFTCPTGIQLPRDGNRMSIDLFKRILDKLQFEDKIKIFKIQLYRWSDPLLHKELHLFIEECNLRGFRCATSSVLQAMQCDLEKVIASKPTEFRASFSGWEQMHIFQKGANPERFIKNLERVAKMPTHRETERVFFFHRYKTNGHEEAPARRLAEDNGFKFVAFEATYMLYDRIVENFTGEKPYTDEERDVLDRLTEYPEENISRLEKEPSENDYCRMQNQEITLDSYGRVQQCQMMYQGKNIMGSVLDEPMKDIRMRIVNNPFCVSCKKSGVIPYSKIFGDPATKYDPKATADKGKYVEELV